MSIYRVKVGVDQPLGDLVTVAPQPASTGVQFTRRIISGDGGVFDQGPYIELGWRVLGTAATYKIILTQFGLATASTAAVTLYARNEDWEWFRFNGLAVRPQMGVDAIWRDYFGRNLTILVKQLVQLVEP